MRKKPKPDPKAQEKFIERVNELYLFSGARLDPITPFIRDGFGKPAMPTEQESTEEDSPQ